MFALCEAFRIYIFAWKNSSSKQWTRQKQISGLALHLIFLLYNCCVSVVLWLDKEDYPENSNVVFCPNEQRSFEPFMLLGLVVTER